MLRTNKQTDKQTASNVLPTPTDRVGVDIITRDEVKLATIKKDMPQLASVLTYMTV